MNEYPEAARAMLNVIREQETQSQGQEVTPQQIAQVARRVFDLYSLVYRLPKDIPIHLLAPIEESNKYVGKCSDVRIPRGKWETAVAFKTSPDKKRILGIEGFPPERERVCLVAGDPSLVHEDNFQGVYRHILGHELTHGQTKPLAVVGVKPKLQIPSNINFGGEIHYIIGFKAVSLNPAKGLKYEPTRRLEEYVDQSLIMHAFNAFKEPDPVLETIKTHGRGIDADSIIAAEILNSVFQANKIPYKLVELYHCNSDIPGFVDLLEDAKLGLGRKLIGACCVVPDTPGVLRRLEEVCQKYG